MESKMPDKWMPLKRKPIPHDVIRFTQPDWNGPTTIKRRRKKAKKPWGEHRITAAVLTVDDSGFVRLSVITDEIIANEDKWPLKTFKKDEVITKKVTTIMKGSPERWHWGGRDGEDARAAVAGEPSKFLKADGF
jgi:hypothetical protein